MTVIPTKSTSWLRSSGAKSSSTMVIVWPGGVSAAIRGRFIRRSLKLLESSCCLWGAISFIFTSSPSLPLFPFGGCDAQSEDRGCENPDYGGVTQGGNVVAKYHGGPQALVDVIQRQ